VGSTAGKLSLLSAPLTIGPRSNSGNRPRTLRPRISAKEKISRSRRRSAPARSRPPLLRSTFAPARAVLSGDQGSQGWNQCHYDRQDGPWLGTVGQRQIHWLVKHAVSRQLEHRTTAIIGKRVATADLSIRTTSGANARTVAEVKKGAALSVTGAIQNGRAQTIYKGAIRWVTAKYLQTSEAICPLHPSCPRSLAAGTPPRP
jgi:uncharacterized protein YgiM (DUF1202 family)